MEHQRMVVKEFQTDYGVETECVLVPYGMDYNAVSSKVVSTPDIGLHAPVLDIDFGARLLPSSTEGHFHLYLDKSMTWRKYKRLLRALYRAGIVERGFYRTSKQRGFSTLRAPGIKKVTA